MIPLLLVKIIAVAMAVILAISFLTYANKLKKAYEKNLSEFSEKTAGRVVRQWKKEVTLDSGEVSTTWYIDYAYTVEGKAYEKCSDIGHYKKMFGDDAEVELLYKKDDPEKFYVPAENGGDRTAYKILYTLGGIVIALGIAMFVLLNIVL